MEQSRTLLHAVEAWEWSRPVNGTFQFTRRAVHHMCDLRPDNNRQQSMEKEFILGHFAVIECDLSSKWFLIIF